MTEIESVIKKNLIGVDSDTKERLVNEILSIVHPLQTDKPLRPHPTTSRNFSKKYKNQIKLHTIEQGCIAAIITSTVIAGVILKFIEKLVFEEGKESKIIISSSKTNVYIFDGESGKKNLQNRKWKSY